MSNRREIILELCQLLAQQENLKVTIREAAKGAGIIGLSSLFGALVGGKSGLLAGAALGGAASMAMGSQFRSVVSIIRNDMTEIQRERLVNSISNLLSGIQITSAVSGLALLSNNTTLKQSVLRGITTYVQKEMSCISLAMVITMKMRRRYKSVDDVIKNELTLSQMEKLLSTVERCTRSNLIMNLDSGTEMDLKDAIALMIMRFVKAEYEDIVLLPRNL